MAEIRALDIEIETPFESGGTAYVRLHPELKDFLLLCHEKHGVVGFTWDPESPWNLGVVVKDKPNPSPV